MKRFAILTLAMFTLVINMSFLMPMFGSSALVSIAHADSGPAPAPNPSATTAYPGGGPLGQCIIYSTQTGVLISHPVAGVAAKSNASVFSCYIGILLNENMPFVVLIATIIIIASGVMYMLSGGSASELGKAKQRIGGVLGGVALYFLIRFLLPLVANGLTL